MEYSDNISCFSTTFVVEKHEIDLKERNYMSTLVIHPGSVEYKKKLDSFGLTEDILQSVGEKIFGDYMKATPNDVKGAAGSLAYFGGIRALRDILCPLGWQKHCEGNVEMVLEPSSQFAITASSGNKDTGNERKEPKTKNHKGNETARLIIKNQSESHLLFPEMALNTVIYNPEHTATWFLLYHVDSVKNEVKMELSLPISIDVYSMRVDQWKERIILATVSYDGTPIDTTNQNETYLDFDIEIKRKNNE